MLLRDVAKSFDKIWQDGLRYKLAQLQLPNILQKLLITFLNIRTAKIKISTEFS